MPFTALATKVYKDALTVQWGNSLKGNIEAIGPHGVWAWAKFDGSGTTTNISSYNVSSVIRQAAGNYTVTFTTGFQTSNYAAWGMAAQSNAAILTVIPDAASGTAAWNPNSFKFQTVSSGVLDAGFCTVMFAATGTGV